MRLNGWSSDCQGRRWGSISRGPSGRFVVHARTVHWSLPAPAPGCRRSRNAIRAAGVAATFRVQRRCPRMSRLSLIDQLMNEYGLTRGAPAKLVLRRHRCGKGFRFVDAKGSAIRDASTVHRLKSLAMPPCLCERALCGRSRGAPSGGRGRCRRAPAVSLPSQLGPGSRSPQGPQAPEHCEGPARDWSRRTKYSARRLGECATCNGGGGSSRCQDGAAGRERLLCARTGNTGRDDTAQVERGNRRDGGATPFPQQGRQVGDSGSPGSNSRSCLQGFPDTAGATPLSVSRD